MKSVSFFLLVLLGQICHFAHEGHAMPGGVKRNLAKIPVVGMPFRALVRKDEYNRNQAKERSTLETAAKANEFNFLKQFIAQYTEGGEVPLPTEYRERMNSKQKSSRTGPQNIFSGTGSVLTSEKMAIEQTSNDNLMTTSYFKSPLIRNTFLMRTQGVSPQNSLSFNFPGTVSDDRMATSSFPINTMNMMTSPMPFNPIGSVTMPYSSIGMNSFPIM